MASATPAADEALRLRRARRWAGAALLLAALAVVLLGLFVGGQDLLRYLRHVSPQLILTLLGFSLVNYAMRAWRWDVFARQRRIHVPFLRQALYYVAGFALTVTPGKLGELLRLWLMRQGEGQPYGRTLPLLLADRLADGLALLLLACAGIATFQNNILSAIVPAAAILLGAWWLGTRPRLLLVFAHWLQRRIGRGERSLRKLHRLMGEISALLRSGPFLFGLVLSVVGWMAEAMALWWLLGSMDAPLSLFVVTFIFAVAMLAGAAAMLPGGLGGAEISMVALLVGFGVATEPSVVATAIIRLTTLWFAVGLGFLVLPFALRVARSRP
jgi:uncharacterized protein (TIRG00374 family)